jgi:hypothetical protein
LHLLHGLEFAQNLEPSQKVMVDTSVHENISKFKRG